jgi:hypothetical protein
LSTMLVRSSSMDWFKPWARRRKRPSWLWTSAIRSICKAMEWRWTLYYVCLVN